MRFMAENQLAYDLTIFHEQKLLYSRYHRPVFKQTNFYRVLLDFR